MWISMDHCGSESWKWLMVLGRSDIVHTAMVSYAGKIPLRTTHLSESTGAQGCTAFPPGEHLSPIPKKIYSHYGDEAERDEFCNRPG